MDSKYAIVKIGGKQMMVSEGYIFEIERQEQLNMDVLLFSDGKKVEIGEPVLTDVEVKADVLDEKMGKKITVARFKSKSRYRRKKGHRQPLSVVKIKSITKKGAKKPTKKTVSEEKKKPVKTKKSNKKEEKK